MNTGSKISDLLIVVVILTIPTVVSLFIPGLDRGFVLFDAVWWVGVACLVLWVIAWSSDLYDLFLRLISRSRETKTFQD